MAEAVTEPVVHPHHVMDTSGLCRKEKRKAIKKMKRRQLRKDAAQKDLEEEVMRLNDPEEQRRIEMVELMDKERMERERKLFEEREREWIQTIELKKKIDEEKEEQRRRDLEEDSKKQQAEVERKDEFADEGWEYIEEGPAEIIWKGNEITVKKKRIRVPKKDIDLNRNTEEGSSLSFKSKDADRPTSNPFPPDSEAFAADSSTLSAQALIENVAQQVPHFGTEQDKAHCPFHLKTGACRFGPRCSRVHFYPDKSCTLLVKNMYTGPGLAWEQDEGLERFHPSFCSKDVHDFAPGLVGMRNQFMDEEVERCYEEFYEDVHTEFLKFGEIINFKVCKNGSFHLRGNVYVHYRFLDSAESAFHSLNGRFFAGKQITCEFVNLTRWKVAICGEYMKSRFKTCSHGTACNFIHCFRNPSGDYEWADIDKPPPRYWIKKIATLFSYSNEQLDEILMEAELNTSKGTTADGDSYHSRRSISRETGWGRRNDYDRQKRHNLRSDEKTDIEERVDGRRKSGKYVTDSDGDHTDDRNRHHSIKRKSPSRLAVEAHLDGDWSEEDADTKMRHHHGHRRSRCRDEDSISADRHGGTRKFSRHELNVGLADDCTHRDRNDRVRGEKFWVEQERGEDEYCIKRPESSGRCDQTRKGSDGNGSRKDKASKRGKKLREQDVSIKPCDRVGQSEKARSGCLKESHERWVPEGFVDAFE